MIKKKFLKSTLAAIFIVTFTTSFSSATSNTTNLSNTRNSINTNISNYNNTSNTSSTSNASNTSNTLSHDKKENSISFKWENATIYYLMTDRFFNGDTSNDESYGRKKVDAKGKNVGTYHGGDFKGITKKLEEGYFKDLGINAIWITAPYEGIHGFISGGKNGEFAHYGFHGYYPLDFTSLDKNFGTYDEFKKLVDTAHSQDIRIILDVVMNHVGYNTLADMEEFSFGKINTIDASW